MRIFERDYVNISLNTEIPCVMLVWNGFVESEKFKEAILVMVDYIMTNKNKYKKSIQLFADTRNLGIVNRETIDWMAKETDPKLFNAGVRKIAFIVPLNDFTKNSIKQYKAQVYNAGDKLHPREFLDTDIEEAKQWLKSEDI